MIIRNSSLDEENQLYYRYICGIIKVAVKIVTILQYFSGKSVKLCIYSHSLLWYNIPIKIKNNIKGEKI